MSEMQTAGKKQRPTTMDNIAIVSAIIEQKTAQHWAEMG